VLGSFSKASFVVGNDADKDVAVNDPDFWNKVIAHVKRAEVVQETRGQRSCRK
jgi:hypothetical protein